RLMSFLDTADERAELTIKAIVAIGEAPIVFRGLDSVDGVAEKLENLVKNLWEVETFYDTIGGIAGYHYKVLDLILQKEKKTVETHYLEHYAKPKGFHLSNQNPDLDSYVRWGVEYLPEMAEMYPVGGAGDRLNLHDPSTGELLPAAQLRFCGKTLLEGLIRDLQAREYLYYKLLGKQLTTPILMMTSHEKHNHEHIQEICSEKRWFGRPRDHFFFFVQPLVPVITLDGHWSMKALFELTWKPGGHGVIWKLARDNGAFQWLGAKHRKKALLRQINNPVAGTDFGLLAFCGIGCRKDKAFGFASCPRVVHTAQGMDVLVEREVRGGYEYFISNIEYTDFAHREVQDSPEELGSPYSKYPSNTNILFVDLKTVEETLSKNPIPGMIINLKNKVPYIDEAGQRQEGEAGRLESTMQNISDYIVNRFPKRLEGEALLNIKAFVTYNDRRKTISVTKRLFDPSKPLLETPEGCFYEILQNHRDVLHHHCHMNVPEICSEEEYIRQGPNLMLQFHPALGPLYSIIAQKIRGGELLHGSEMQLEIAELDLENLHLNGSLLIMAESPTGRFRSNGILEYGEDCGKCILRNVRIKNKGIDRSARDVYWKNEISRHEKVLITLQGNAEFIAEDLAFEGEHLINVPDGYRFIAYEKEGKILFRQEKITEPTWFWNYIFDASDQVKLSKKNGDT
ncbi:MAG: UTP--glucose-1-phosphate uridylyltransferase, partial [Waddliaceae bacterium]